MSVDEAKTEAARLRAEAKAEAGRASIEKAERRAQEAQARAAREAEEEAAKPPSERLLKAAANGDVSAVRNLLSHGADARFTYDPPGVWGSCDTKTALHCALMGRGRQDIEQVCAVVHLLLDAGADVNAVRRQYDWRGCGHSETAFEMLLNAPEAMRIRLLESFITKGADPNLQRVRSQHSMRTDGTIVSYPLHAAVRNKDTATAAILLRAGAAVDAAYTEDIQNERGYNETLRKQALHLAVEAGSVELTALLLAEGADANAEAEYLEQRASGAKSPHDDPRSTGFKPPVTCVPVRETALHIALRRNDVDLVRALLVGGADAGVLRLVGSTSTQESTTAEELCNGDSRLLSALKTARGWTPESHRYFGAELKERVRAVLLTAKANKWVLPDDAMHTIFAQLAAPE